MLFALREGVVLRMQLTVLLRLRDDTAVDSYHRNVKLVMVFNRTWIIMLLLIYLNASVPSLSFCIYESRNGYGHLFSQIEWIVCLFLFLVFFVSV